MKKYIGFLIVLSFFVLGTGTAKAEVSVNTSTAPCVPSLNRGNVVVSLDGNNPANMIVSPGSNNVEVLRIALKNTSQGNVCLNGIHLGSSENVNNFINKTSVFDVATGLQVGQTSYYFSNNGSYYYSWISPTSSISIAPGATKVFKIVSDFSPTAIQGEFQMGNWGLNFDRPGSTMSPQVVSGNIISVNNSTSNGKPSVTVLTPNGGETFILGQQINVTWDTKQFSNNAHVGIDLTQKVGDVYSAIRALAQTTNDGNEVVTIPTDVKLGDNYLITVGIIEIGVSPHILDRSDSTFTINSFSTFSSKFPDGCNSAAGFSPTTGLPCFLDTYAATSITKSGAVLNGRLIANAPAEMYFIYAKTGNGIKVQRTAKIAQQSNGLFSYALSNLSPNTSYDFKACMYYVGAERCARQLTFKTFPASYSQEKDGCKNRETYSSTTGQKCSTTIEPEQKPLITVLSPNGGEVVNISNPLTVTFKSNNVTPAKHYINLVDANDNHGYSLDSLLGSSGLQLTQNQINQPTQSIIVSIPESFNLNLRHNYAIEICVNNICDKSDSTFTLAHKTVACSATSAPSVKVRTPNGGESYTVGEIIETMWSSCNLPTNSKMTVGLYVSETGQHYYFAGPHNDFTPNDGKEEFVISKNVPAGQYTLTVSADLSANGPTVIDYSDTPFTVRNKTDNSDLRVISPNGGETYTAGQRIIVKWESKNIPKTDKVNISITNGIEKSKGLSTINDGEEVYQIPENFAPNKDYVLFITTSSGIENYAVDNSDNFFTIIKEGDLPINGTLTLLSPQSGSRIVAGSTLEVKWASYGFPTRDGNYVRLIIKKGGVTIKQIKTEDDGSDIVTIPLYTPTGEYQVEYGIITPANNGGEYYQKYGSASFTVVKLATAYDCKNGQVYSSATGQRCVNPIIEEQKCSPATDCYYSDATTGTSTGASSLISTGASPSFSRILKIGVKGEDVKYIQTLLGITADGTYGPATAMKVREWQASRQLKADGIIGPQSFSIMNQ